MKDDMKRELFKELCQHNEELNTNAFLVQKIINERLKYIPHKKLYKFRPCTIANFKTLEENCIWMAPASSFNDLFDSTINIDLAENRREIEDWLYNSFPVLCFDLVKKLCEDMGVRIPYIHADFVEYVNTCLDENGKPIAEKEKAFIEAHATPEDLVQMDYIFEMLKKYRNMFAEKEDQMVDTIIKAINDTRVCMRDSTLIYCMTERYDNPILWENYAKDYTGFCIEYDFSKYTEQAFDDYKNLVYMFPMSYRKKKPYFDMVPILDVSCRKSIYKEENVENDLLSNVDLNMQLYYKNKDYEFEHEWRFSIKNKSNNKQPFPFVSAIYAGKDIKQGNLKRLCNIAKKLGVPVYKQTTNKANNGFVYKKVGLVNK